MKIIQSSKMRVMVGFNKKIEKKFSPSTKIEKNQTVDNTLHTVFPKYILLLLVLVINIHTHI